MSDHAVSMRHPYFDLSPSPCFSLDTTGAIAEINGAARSALGFDPVELLGRNVIELVHPEDRGKIHELVNGQLGPHSVRQMDVRMQSRVGGHRWFHWSAGRLGSDHVFVVATETVPGAHPASWPAHVNDPYRMLVESVSDYAIYLLDEQGYITSWNSGARLLKGYDAADVLGKHFSLFFTPEDQAAGIPQLELEKATRTGRVENEGWRVRKDGTRFWANVVLSALREPTGKVIGFCKLTRDLTGKQLALEKLRASEERLRLLVNGTSDYAILMLDPVGRVTSWNAGAERIKGYRADEIIGKHFSVFYTEEDIAIRKPARALETALSAGRFEDASWRVRKDGTRFWASVVISPLRSETGELLGFGKVTRDLTERRQAEESLRLSEQRFRLLVETVRDYAIFMLDPEGRVVSWNRGAEQMKGYRVAEALGQHFSLFYTPEDIAERLPLRELELAMKEGRAENEGWRLRKDGTRFWANVVITRMDDDAGRVIGFAKVTRDLSQRKLMEEAIQRSNEELERRVADRTMQLGRAQEAQRKLEVQLAQSAKMEAVGRLAGGVAHDFNNMLTVIKGHCELLLETPAPVPDGQLRESVREVLDAATRSTDLTRQLLAFSRRQILMPRVIDVNEAVRTMLPMLSRLIGEHIRVETVLSPSLLRSKADPSQLEQVLLNLVLNARDAMPNGGKLTVETQNATLDETYCAGHAEAHPGLYVMLSISDTGHGMDEETKRRIFEPFFTTKAQGRGTGLGLSTVHGIVRQSGGHIQAYSETGRGTSFKVYLPATESPVEHAELIAAGDTAPGARREATILLVEDEAPVRRLARSILLGAGYRVIEAGDAPQAVSIARQSNGPIDLLLTDVVMPGDSGMALYHQLRDLLPTLLVIYMSGYTENAVVHQGVLDPGVVFLPKPFTRERLLTRVREVLHGVKPA